jgi:hypothetical protein
VSESSGGTTVVQQAVSDVEIEVRMRFISRDYTPAQLATRIEDVDSLLRLLISPRVILSGRPPSGLAKAAGTVVIHTGRTTRRGSAFRSATRASGYYALRSGLSRSSYSPRRGATITVESASLHSPFEITLVVLGVGAGVLTRFSGLIPKLIEMKNSWHESQVVGAESKAKIAEANLKTTVLNKLSEDVGGINLDRYDKLKDDHPSKKIVKGAVRALTELDSAEVRKRS